MAISFPSSVSLFTLLNKGIEPKVLEFVLPLNLSLSHKTLQEPLRY